jgi:hypothetical protein
MIGESVFLVTAVFIQTTAPTFSISFQYCNSVLYSVIPCVIVQIVGILRFLSCNTVTVFWFEDLLLLWFILLSIFVPQTVAVYTLYTWVLFKKLSFLMWLVNV